MSTHTDCRDAARSLLKDPNLAIHGIKGIFTEVDVILLASRSGGWYTQNDQQVMNLALRDVNQLMGEMFRRREVARYGPVPLTKLGLDEEDWARIAGKMIYAHPEHGPEVIETPNGVFPRAMTENDTIGRSGRKLGSNRRNDLKDWDEQEIIPVAPKKQPKPTTAEQREIIRLKAEVAALQQKLADSETENHRLREHHAETISRSEVEDVVASLEGRLTELENGRS